MRITSYGSLVHIYCFRGKEVMVTCRFCCVFFSPQAEYRYIVVVPVPWNKKTTILIVLLLMYTGVPCGTSRTRYNSITKEGVADPRQPTPAVTSMPRRHPKKPQADSHSASPKLMGSALNRSTACIIHAHVRERPNARSVLPGINKGMAVAQQHQVRSTWYIRRRYEYSSCRRYTCMQVGRYVRNAFARART